MYHELLEASGLRPSVVGTARDALARLRDHPPPQAVIFDIVLPDMTPLAFCEAMEALIADTKPCKRIVVTGWLLSAADRAALTRYGVTEIYMKPCNTDELLQALHP